MKSISILGFCLLFLVSCQNSTSTPPKTSVDGNEFFGEAFTPGKALTVDQLLSSMAGKESVEAFVEGEVTAVCKKKGCWMTMAAGGEEDVMVRFKDYGFFVPLELTGKVLIKGEAKEQITTVADLQHYAEDDGASQEEIDAITEPKRQVHFTATGVMKL